MSLLSKELLNFKNMSSLQIIFIVLIIIYIFIHSPIFWTYFFFHLLLINNKFINLTNF